MDGPLVENMGELMAPCETTCNNSIEKKINGGECDNRCLGLEILSTKYLNKNIGIQPYFLTEKNPFRKRSHHTALVEKQ